MQIDPTRRLFSAAVLLLLSIMLLAFADSGAIKERNEIPDKYKWNTEDIYKSDADWEKDVAAAPGLIAKLRTYEGKISKSPDSFLAFMKDYEQANKVIENIGLYANMLYDQDTREQKYAGYNERIQTIFADFSEAVSWFTPEMVAVSASEYEKWFQQNPAMVVYRHFVDDALRQRAHTLSPAEERIIALSGNAMRCPSTANQALCNSDMQFPTIKDEDGNDVELSEGRFYPLLLSSDKNVRRNAAISMLSTYGKFKNTSAALMSGNMATDVFSARARGYNSCLHASLDADNIDTTVYLNLIAAVKKNANVIQRYCDLRRKALGLDEIHLYDMSAVLSPDLDEKITYDQAVVTINDALKPLGPKYLDAANMSFTKRWIDVYENKGKTSGAYSTGSYLSHPYILLNYSDTMDDMFTTAHELGHSMHTWMSREGQPWIYSNYTLFNAEVASTFNEALLMDHLLKKEKDPDKRLSLLAQYIDNIRGTVITQVMFADFELRMHRAAEAGEPLTAETLGELYMATVRDYYGDAVVYDPEYAYTWARIPHFYRGFYVYKYATSFCASQALSQAVLKGEKGAKERFLNYLSSGSSTYPIQLLKDAGVDMTTIAPVDATMKKFGELVDEMEKVLKDMKRI